MYSVFRCFIVLIISFITLVIIIKRRGQNIKRNIILLFFVAILLYSLFIYLPIENYFITFDNPELVYKYVKMDSADCVIKGDNSAMLISLKDNGNSEMFFVPKSTNGWIIEMNLQIKGVYHNILDGFPICVYRHKATNDYYITIYSSDGEIEVYQNNKTNSAEFKKINIFDNNYYCYYYIGNDVNAFSFYINDCEYNISW